MSVLGGQRHCRAPAGVATTLVVGLFSNTVDLSYQGHSDSGQSPQLGR